jgi:hypothetical protein
VRDLVRAVLLLPLAATACGGGRVAPASCGHVGTFGGDVVGDWTFAGSCVDSDALAILYRIQFETSCTPEITVSDDVTLAAVPATVSFNADGTYAGKVVLSGSIGIRIPTTCLAGTCADLDTRLRAMVAPGGDYRAASCSESVTGCACSLELGRAASETGTYTADGFSLVTQPAEGPSSTYARYAVTEPELHLMTVVPTSAAQDATLRLASDIVLTRRK